MTLSRHLHHLRTQQHPSRIPENAELPVITNKFELRRNRAAIKIPKRLSGIIAKDKQLLKPFAIYFELKPLYYSSVIKNARHHYKDLCEYLDISINNLRQKIADMVRMDLAWWDGKDLRLKSYAKVCQQYELSRFYHKVNNIGKTEINLRVIALKENFDNQKYTLTKKIVNYELKQIFTELHLPQLKQVGGSPEMVKRILSDQNIEKYFNVGKLRKHKRIINRRMDVLKKLAQDRTDYNLINGIKCNRTPNPETTLSCQGVATLYGCTSPGAGYYWEQILQAKQFIDIKGHVIEIHNQASPIVWDKVIDQQNNGVFATRTKKGKKHFFLRLPNSLTLTQNPLFS